MMNSRLRILIDTEIFNKIKKLASDSNLTISDFCRRKLCPPQPDKMEQMIEEIYRKIILKKGNLARTSFINSVAGDDSDTN